MKKYWILVAILCLLLQLKGLCEEIELPRVESDPGVVNNLNRNVINELIEQEEELESEENKEIGEIDSLNTANIQINQTNYASNEYFEIKNVEISGNTIFKKKDLDKYFNKIITKKSSIKDITNCVTTLNKMYESKGYVTTYAYVPKNAVNGDTLKINIVEGRIGDINIAYLKYTKQYYLRHILLGSNGIEKDHIFNIHNIENINEAINANKYIKGKVSVAEGEGINNNLDLKIIEKRPIKLDVMWDNDGNELVGQNRTMMLLEKDNLFGLGHQIYGGTLLARGTTGAIAGYKAPIGNHGTELQFNYSYSHIALLGEYSGEGFKGNAATYTTRVVQPLYTRKNLKVKTDLGLDFVDAHASKREEKYTSSINDYRLTVLRHGVNVVEHDKSGVSIGRLESSFGLPILGAKESRKTENSDGVNLRDNFYKFKLTLLRLQKIKKESMGIARLTTQYSPNNLYATEQMNFGGIGTMRGYEPGETLSDSGVNGTLELRTPVPFLKTALPERYKKYSDRAKLGFFYDWGVFANHNGWGNMSSGENFLESIGEGIHIKLTDSLDASWEIGVPIGGSNHRGKDAVMYFAVKADVWDMFSKKPKEEDL